MRIEDKTLIGWEEWCALSSLSLPAIKAKIDTGAKTSCLHADDITIISAKGKDFVEFTVHPLQSTDELSVKCRAPLIDHRFVTNSGGVKEKRYVIATTIKIGTEEWPIEMTLTQRYTMKFRMLLGRDAMRTGHLIVDPCKSYVHGKYKKKEVSKMYKKEK